MTTSVLNTSVSLICFWTGLAVLVKVVRVYRRSQNALRRAARLQGDLEAALAERRSVLQRTFPEHAELGRVCRASELAADVRERYACEADIDAAVYLYSKSARGDATPGQAHARQIIEKAEADLRPFRERYNESVLRVKALRQSMPSSIVMRSLISEDLPSIPNLDLT